MIQSEEAEPKTVGCLVASFFLCKLFGKLSDEFNFFLIRVQISSKGGKEDGELSKLYVGSLAPK